MSALRSGGRSASHNSIEQVANTLRQYSIRQQAHCGRHSSHSTPQLCGAHSPRQPGPSLLPHSHTKRRRRRWSAANDHRAQLHHVPLLRRLRPSPPCLEQTPSACLLSAAVSRIVRAQSDRDSQDTRRSQDRRQAPDQHEQVQGRSAVCHTSPYLPHAQLLPVHSALDSGVRVLARTDPGARARPHPPQSAQ